MKKFLLLIAATILYTVTYAQDAKVSEVIEVSEEDEEDKEGKYGKFDFEIGFQVPVLASTYPGNDYNIAPLLFLEGRWQLEKQPIDIGFHMGISAIVREFSDGSDASYRAFPVLAVSDYQFGRGKKVNPYVGLGVGISMNDMVRGPGPDRVSFAAMPRVGVRFFKFLNIQVAYLITHRDFSRMYVNLGFYF